MQSNPVAAANKLEAVQRGITRAARVSAISTAVKVGGAFAAVVAAQAIASRAKADGAKPAPQPAAGPASGGGVRIPPAREMAERDIGERVFSGVQGAVAIAAGSTIGRMDGRFGRFVLKPTLLTLGSALVADAVMRSGSAKADGAKPAPQPAAAPSTGPTLVANQGTPLGTSAFPARDATFGTAMTFLGATMMKSGIVKSIKAASAVGAAVRSAQAVAGAGIASAGVVKTLDALTTPFPSSGTTDIARQAAARTASDMGASQVVGTFSGGAAPGSTSEPRGKGRVDSYTRMQNGQMVQVSGYQLMK